MAGKEGVIVQSVARALTILDCFSENSQLGISEISADMDLSKSTVFGLVNTLVAYGYLEQAAESKKYKLGIRLFELGSIVQRRMDLRNEARPYCEELAHKYNQTVHLAAYDKGEVVYIDKVDMPDYVIVYSQVGRRAPMHCTGVGKAVLAYLPLEYIHQYVLDKPLVKKTPETITDQQELLQNLEMVRRLGYAVDDEEIGEGLKCVAAPIFDHKGGPVAAVSISGTAGKMKNGFLEEVAADVKKTAGAISQRLGHSRQA